MKTFEDLKQKYPELLGSLNSVECDKGWFELIEQACRDLTELGIPDLRFLQIKEKFGGLRMYTSVNSYEISSILGEISGKSYCTCETCGDPGKVRQYPYILTLCDSCAVSFESSEDFISFEDLE